MSEQFPAEPATPGGARGPAGLGGPAAGPPVLVTEAGWHRLHPLSPLVRASRQLLSLVVVLVGIAVLNQHSNGSAFGTELIVIGIGLVAGFVSWLVTRWQLAGDVLLIESGLIRRSARRLPLAQIQAVDIVQSGLARVLGLAELQLRMAGGGAASGRLACLRLAEAEELRQRLLALAPARAAEHGGLTGAGAASGPAAGAAPERPASAGAAAGAAGAGRGGAAGMTEGRLLFSVRGARLPAAMAFSRRGLVALVTAAAVGLTIGLTGSDAAIALPFVLGVAVSLWRQFNGEYGTSVAITSDGLRLRSGLVQTTAETIRAGRIQAVRLSEPLFWRPLHWCRLEVDVAGGRQRGEDRPEGQRLRALIPVGSREQAAALLAELLPGCPQPVLRPPPVTRWKAPLGYHFLGWNADDRYAVAARGRVRRETTWVPLAKVQSFRWAQGPVQRRLGLASVFLDVAGRRVTLKGRDRTAAEAAAILANLPDLARAARQSAR